MLETHFLLKTLKVLWICAELELEAEDGDLYPFWTLSAVTRCSGLGKPSTLSHPVTRGTVPDVTTAHGR